jgi:hypothetical protein
MPRPIRIAKGRRPGSRKGRTKLEGEFLNLLIVSKHEGTILDYREQPMGLRLAPNTFYHPDFLVIDRDQTVTVYEVKGHWEDDARVKIKVAAKEFPWFRFVAVTKSSMGFQYEKIPCT